jgi:hypothetical protein
VSRVVAKLAALLLSFAIPSGVLAADAGGPETPPPSPSPPPMRVAWTSLVTRMDAHPGPEDYPGGARGLGLADTSCVVRITVDTVGIWAMSGVTSG